jgi:hypothetical protein
MLRCDCSNSGRLLRLVWHDETDRMHVVAGIVELPPNDLVVKDDTLLPDRRENDLRN